MSSIIPFHGGQLRQIADRFGIPETRLLDFSANINPEGPSPTVLATLRASLEDLSVLTSYPDLEETALRESIARYAAVSPENIAVANGFVPLLEAALRSLGIRRCLLPVPAFVEYRKTLERAQVEVTPHILTPDSNFSYNIEQLTHSKHDAILLANPQNPSGVLCSHDHLLRLAASAAERNTYLLLDEAFIDYEPEHSLTRDTVRFPNLIVFRSVTKFHGIPGLRAAYAVSNTDLIRKVNGHLPPWPISTLASRAVSAALEDEPYAIRTRLLNRQRRIRLRGEIETLGISTYSSSANFLLLRLPRHINPVSFWQHMIVEHRIVVRSCANYEALPAGHLRVAVRGEEENSRLVQALTQTLSAQPNKKIRSRRAVSL